MECLINIWGGSWDDFEPGWLSDLKKENSRGDYREHADWGRNGVTRYQGGCHIGTLIVVLITLGCLV